MKRTIKKSKSDANGSVTPNESINFTQEPIMANTSDHSQRNDVDLNAIISPNFDRENSHDNLTDLQLLELLRKNHQFQITNNTFNSDLFQNNPLIEAGKKMYTKLEETKWTKCVICKECHICFPLNEQGKCSKCSGDGINSKTFTSENDLDPGEAPECLTRLFPVEKSAISIICPSLTVVKCGSYSSKSKGHAISFYQNVQDLANVLPRLPQDLPYVLLKHPDERITDKTFQVRRQYLMEALQFLVKNSEDYFNITVSMENCCAYPVDDIIQNLPQISTKDLKSPHEAPSTANPDSNIEYASTVDMPFPVKSVIQNMELQ